jgi:hypothetical protein
MWKNFKVIDADAHMHEPQHLWQRYVEPKYRDQVSKVAIHAWQLHGLLGPDPDSHGFTLKGGNEELRIGDFGCSSSGRSDSI